MVSPSSISIADGGLSVGEGSGETLEFVFVIAFMVVLSEIE